MNTLNSGPPPKDPATRARRNKPATSAVQLPAEGRKGDAPEWPPGMYAHDDTQQEMWEELWRSPQAVAWERNGIGALYEVAHLVHFTFAVTPNADLERRQLSDRLGLNPLAMRRLGWEVKAPDIAAAEAVVTSSQNKRFEGLRSVAKVAE